MPAVSVTLSVSTLPLGVVAVATRPLPATVGALYQVAVVVPVAPGLIVSVSLLPVSVAPVSLVRLRVRFPAFSFDPVAVTFVLLAAVILLPVEVANVVLASTTGLPVKVSDGVEVAATVIVPLAPVVVSEGVSVTFSVVCVVV